jgi:hypothetical protein
MVPDLISLEDARVHLRLDDVDSDGSPDDPWLTVFITAVSHAVGLWLKEAWRLYEVEIDSDGEMVLDSEGTPVNVLDSAGDFLVVPAVRAACLIELERQYRFRGGEGVETEVPQEAGHGYTLGRGATALLTPLRRSTVA